MNTYLKDAHMQWLSIIPLQTPFLCELEFMGGSWILIETGDVYKHHGLVPSQYKDHILRYRDLPFKEETS